MDYAGALLTRLHVSEGQWLEIRVVVPDVRGARQFFCTSIEEALRVVNRWNERGNIYVSALPRSSRSGVRAAVAHVTAFWADLDFHQIDSADRTKAEEAARERIARFPHRPSLLVHTGNGLQVWWLLSRPVPLSEAWPAERFEGINRGIAGTLGGDAVHDLARVLRVPGTLNLPDARKRARGCVPVMARLIQSDGPTYRVDDLAYLEASQREGRFRGLRDHNGAPAAQPDPEVVQAFLALLRELPDDHLLVRTWVGDRALRDRSRSGWDMALADQLFLAGIREEPIRHILRAFPKGRGSLATNDYLATIAKATGCAGGERESARHR